MTSVTIAPTSSTTRTAAVSLEDVTVSFDAPDGTEKTVLHNIDLKIQRGEFVALVGRSGCGKTTLLNIIAGLVTPTSGELNILDTTAQAARSRMGFMMARDALLPWRTARRNVEYGLELRGVPRAERRAAASQWLSAVGLSDAAKLWPWQLSQGMRQRVALARTWALNPDILLMDEPFAALDAQTRVNVQSAFIDLWQQSDDRSVVFVTHDLHEAIALADRIVVLGDGSIVDDIAVGIDRPRDLDVVSAHPHAVELFTTLRTHL